MSQYPATKSKAAKSRKLVLQLVVGAVAGAATTFAVLSALDGSGFSLDDPSRMAALLTALIFLLMGLFVGLGTAAPGPGARLLNVEDEDEIRDQRRLLGRSSVVIILIGAIMLTLALAGSANWEGFIPPRAAAAIGGVCLVGVIALSWAGRKDTDELLRSMSLEASAWAMYACLLIFTIWGSLAHLGLVAWISPLGLISTLMLVNLVAIYVVTARRGMLRPR